MRDRLKLGWSSNSRAGYRILMLGKLVLLKVRSVYLSHFDLCYFVKTLQEPGLGLRSDSPAIPEIAFLGKTRSSGRIESCVQRQEVDLLLEEAFQDQMVRRGLHW